MGFVTSFLLICFFGFWAYWFYHKVGIPKDHQAFVAWYAIIIVGGLMLIDILIYVGIFDFVFPYLNALSWINIESGKDFMWNSFQLIGIDFGINYKDASLNWIAMMIFLSYPMWFKFMSNGSRMLWGGNQPYYVGAWYLFEPTKTPEKGQEFAKTPGKT